MKEPIIVQENIKSKLQLENKFDFIANITIGLDDGGDFYLTFDFLNLTSEDFKTLVELCKLPRSLSIKSDIIEKEKYNITHIVVTKFFADSNSGMKWECLSDNPDLYDNLTI